MSADLAIREKEIEGQAVEILSTARAISITNNERYVQAGELLLAIKQGRKGLDEMYDDLIEDAHKAHKNALAKKRKYEQPFIEAEGLLKTAIGKFQDEQEAIRRQEELKLQELARKQQEDMALQEGVALEAAGLHQEAEDAISNPVMPAIVLSPSVPKVQGISSRESYYATVTDIKALCRAVADGKVPTMAITPNMSFLNNQARNLKGLMVYPGVRVDTKKIISGKA